MRDIGGPNTFVFNKGNLMKHINPYLTFNGNCEQAFTFHKFVFGGDFTCQTRLGEAPPLEGLRFTADQFLQIFCLVQSFQYSSNQNVKKYEYHHQNRFLYQ
jgi:uncharacterized glyoxalase superfamily protein PhnB